MVELLQFWIYECTWCQVVDSTWNSDLPTLYPDCRKQAFILQLLSASENFWSRLGFVRPPCNFLSISVSTQCRRSMIGCGHGAVFNNMCLVFSTCFTAWCLGKTDEGHAGLRCCLMSPVPATLHDVSGKLTRGMQGNMLSDVPSICCTTWCLWRTGWRTCRVTCCLMSPVSATLHGVPGGLAGGRRLQGSAVQKDRLDAAQG